MFHRHDWNLIDKTIVKNNLPRPTSLQSERGQTMEDMLRPFKDLLVLTFKCDCGAVKTEEHR